MVSFKNLILKYIKHKPTDEQLEAIERLEKFIFSPKTQIFILKGYAGTGKTTLISALVKTLRDLDISCVLLAPTGRSAKIFSQYSESPAFTIHKKIYSPYIENDIVKYFTLSDFCHYVHETIFIVDESSMLSNTTDKDSIFGSGNVLNDFLNYVFTGNSNKIIFCGDEAQLPPVNENSSPALNLETFKNKYTCETFELKKIVRQALNSGIIKLSKEIRDNNSDFWHILKNNKEIFETNDIEIIEPSELMEKLSECYQKDSIDQTVVITFSNKTANFFNENIRKFILSKENTLEKNDYIMIVRNNYVWKDTQNKIPFVANGDIGLVKKISNYEKHEEFEFADGKIELPDYETELKAKIIFNSLYSNTPSLPKEDEEKIFKYFSKFYVKEKNRKELIKKDPYINALQIKYAYAITCHKAQGGQWKNVFLHYDDYINKILSNSLTKNWLYTAITRATEKIFIISKIF